MKIAKDAVLDRVCKRIAEHREVINDATQNEKTEKQTALDRMLKLGTEAYTAWGVELLVSHSDKLRVRLVDDAGGAGQPDDDEVKGEQGDLGTVAEGQE